MQRGETPMARNKFGRCPVLDDPPIMHHENTVRDFHSGQSVRDDHGRPLCASYRAEQVLQSPLHDTF